MFAAVLLALIAAAKAQYGPVSTRHPCTATGVELLVDMLWE
jgi:hypothetical protein